MLAKRREKKATTLGFLSQYRISKKRDKNQNLLTASKIKSNDKSIKKLLKTPPISEFSLELDKGKYISSIPSCNSDSTIKTWVEEKDENLRLNNYNQMSIIKMKKSINEEKYTKITF